MTSLAVRRSSDGTLHEAPFDRDMIDEHITRVLFGRKGPLKGRHVHDVAERAVHRVERELRFLDMRLRPEEFDTHSDILGAIPDHLITENIEAVLRDGRGRRFRMAELLYVMAVRGRVDFRPGWADAGDVLAWIGQRYERLELPEQQRGARVRETVFVQQTNWRPKKVLKRNSDHRPSDFDAGQFRQSITAALHGREHSGTHATMVMHHVLGQLEGQRTVHSAQLAAGALIALRGVDDIGYLRWATITKGIGNIRPFAVEAADLISTPSPRLKWLHPPS